MCVRNDLIGLSRDAHFFSHIFVSHVVTGQFVFDRGGQLSQLVQVFRQTLVQRYRAEYPQGDGRGLLALVGISHRMPDWLRSLWLQRLRRLVDQAR